MKTKIKTAATGPLKILVAFDEQWRVPNSLLQDRKGRMFLADLPSRTEKEDLAGLKPELKAVSLKEGIQWFIHHEQFSNGGTYDTADLLALTVPYLPAK